MIPQNSNSRLVYSTEQGSLCPGCSKAKNSCICNAVKRSTRLESPGPIRINYEHAGRKGKGVTLITGLPLSQKELLELAKKLKQRLGVGGAVKDYTLELQGDQRIKLKEILPKLGCAL